MPSDGGDGFVGRAAVEGDGEHVSVDGSGPAAVVAVRGGGVQAHQGPLVDELLLDLKERFVPAGVFGNSVADAWYG